MGSLITVLFIVTFLLSLSLRLGLESTIYKMMLDLLTDEV